jgi:aryl-alcohol dehydrogenase-like predicted oxidoreductase
MIMDFSRQRPLGCTGLMIGRLGISSSFGAPTAAFEEAFERGCNYFTWGTFIRGRPAAMRNAIGHIVKSGRRDQLVLAMVSYAHSAWLTEYFLIRGLKAAGIEYTDILLLGYFPKKPSQRIIEGVLRLKEKGLVRHIGLTSHNRGLFSDLQAEGLFDVFHVRYNAAHRGAETETFPYLHNGDRPGIVAFTATSWKRLLNPKNLPSGETPVDAADCYRFVLSHPDVDVCMMGAADADQMEENLAVLKSGPMSAEELARMRRIGEYLHRKRK